MAVVCVFASILIHTVDKLTASLPISVVGFCLSNVVNCSGTDKVKKLRTNEQKIAVFFKIVVILVFSLVFNVSGGALLYLFSPPTSRRRSRAILGCAVGSLYRKEPISAWVYTYNTGLNLLSLGGKNEKKNTFSAASL